MFHEQPPAALSRVVVFLAALVLVVVASWTAGRVSGVPLPLPDLRPPTVLGGPGAGGAEEAGGGAAPIAPPHGHYR